MLLNTVLLIESKAEDACTQKNTLDDSTFATPDDKIGCQYGSGWEGKWDSFITDVNQQDGKVSLKLYWKKLVSRKRPDCVFKIEMDITGGKTKVFITPFPTAVTVVDKMPKCKSESYNITIQVQNLKYSGIKTEDICYQATKEVKYEAPEECPNVSNEDKSQVVTNQPGHLNTATAAIAGGVGGGFILLIALMALGVWLYKKGQRDGVAQQMERESQKDAQRLEMNKETNDVYGTYGESGEGDYNIVEDTNPYYEARD